MRTPACKLKPSDSVPYFDAIVHRALGVERMVAADPVVAREELGRWFEGGSISRAALQSYELLDRAAEVVEERHERFEARRGGSPESLEFEYENEPGAVWEPPQARNGPPVRKPADPVTFAR